MSKWLDKEFDYGWVISGEVNDWGELELRIFNKLDNTVSQIDADYPNNGLNGDPIALKFTTNLAESEEFGYFASEVMEFELNQLEGMLITETKPWKIELIEEQIRTLGGSL